jgi:hypothetical protein
MKIERRERVADLPAQWDEQAGNFFRSTQFLRHCELYNPCSQRYYLCSDNENLLGGAVVYSLSMDLLTFLRIKSPLTVNMVGIPASVSAQGLFGSLQIVEELKRHICNTEKGFTLFLNLETKPQKNHFASGRTLPSIVMHNRFRNTEEYLAGLRSHYRRRLSILSANAGSLRFEKSSCNVFDGEIYSQYLQVYERSRDKLEKLSEAFFKNLPAGFSLLACYNSDRLLGWNISLHHTNTFYFFMGGIDYEMNKQFNTYFLLLYELIKEGISAGAEFIDLGQTAETPKMRLGGEVCERYMEGHHSNRFYNGFLKTLSPVLSYRKIPENGRVFKDYATRAEQGIAADLENITASNLPLLR